MPSFVRVAAMFSPRQMPERERAPLSRSYHRLERLIERESVRRFNDPCNDHADDRRGRCSELPASTPPFAPPAAELVQRAVMTCSSPLREYRASGEFGSLIQRPDAAGGNPADS